MSGTVNSGQANLPPVALRVYTPKGDKTTEEKAAKVSQKALKLLKEHLDQPTSEGKSVKYTIIDSVKKGNTTQTTVNIAGTEKTYTTTVTQKENSYTISIQALNTASDEDHLSPTIASITEKVVKHSFGGDTIVPPLNRKTSAFRLKLFNVFGEKYSVPIIYNSVLKEITQIAKAQGLNPKQNEIHLLVAKLTKEQVQKNPKLKERSDAVEDLSRNSLRSIVASASKKQNKASISLLIGMPSPSSENSNNVIGQVFNLVIINLFPTKNSPLKNPMKVGESLLNSAPSNLDKFSELDETSQNTLLHIVDSVTDSATQKQIFDYVLSDSSTDLPDVIFSLSGLDLNSLTSLIKSLSKIEDPSLRQIALKAVLLPTENSLDMTQARCLPKLNALSEVVAKESCTRDDLISLSKDRVQSLVTQHNTDDKSYNVDSLTKHILELPDDVFEEFLSTPYDQDVKIDAIDRLHKSAPKASILSSSQNLKSYLTLTPGDQDKLLESLVKLSDPHIQQQFAGYILTPEQKALDCTAKLRILTMLLPHKPSSEELTKCFSDDSTNALVTLVISKLISSSNLELQHFVIKTLLDAHSKDLSAFLQSELKDQQKIIATLGKISKVSDIDNQKLAQVALKDEARPAVISLLDNTEIKNEKTRSFLLRVISLSQTDLSPEQNMAAQLLISAIAKEAHKLSPPTAAALWESLFKVDRDSDLSGLTEENLLSMAIEEFEDDEITLLQATPFIQEDLLFKSAIALSTGEQNTLTTADFSSLPQIKNPKRLETTTNTIKQHSSDNVTVNASSYERSEELLNSLASLPDKQKEILFFILAKEAGTVPGFSLFAPGIELAYKVDTSKQPIVVTIESQENDKGVSIHVQIQIQKDGTHEYTELNYSRKAVES